MSRDQFDNEGEQFIVSHELLFLLRWIVENHTDELQDFVVTARAKSGLSARADSSKVPPFDYDEAHAYIIDFLGLIEALLLTAKHEDDTQVRLARQLMPAVDQIDRTNCDGETVRSSIETATRNVRKHPKQDAQQILYKEILRRWKPGKRTLN